MDFFEEINNLEYLYLLSIADDQSNSLVLVIKEATISTKEEYIAVGDQSIGPVRNVALDGPGKCYKIRFDKYTAYQVTNESYGVYETDAEREGRLYCRFLRSHYLTYVRETTFAEDIFEKPLQHFAFNCCNHTIDIVSVDAPEIAYCTATSP